MKLEDKTILVTGSTGNTGPEVTDSLIEEGARVIGTYHSEEGMESARKRAEKSEEVIYRKVELTNPEGLESLKKEIEDKIGKVDCIVNLVGGFTGGGLKNTEAAQVRSSFERHVITVFLTVKTFSDHIEEKGGSIVNFVSEKVIEPEPGAVSYTVGKGALNTLTKVLTKEMENSRINAIAPTTINVKPNRERRPNADFDDWTKPSEVVETILFLLSNEAVNGQTIRL